MKPRNFKSLGFFFVDQTPADLNEYGDLRYLKWDRTSLKSDLNFGVLPSGLIIESDSSEERMIVIGNRLFGLDHHFKRHK